MASLDSAAHALAGVIGGATALTFVWPLEKLRLELQSQLHARLHEKGDPDFRVENTPPPTLSTCIQSIWRQRGFQGFYQGFESAIYATSASQLVFFYLYSLLKDALIKRRGRMGPVDNIAVATIAGAINAFATAPIWLVVTRLAIQNKHHDDKDHMRGLLDGFSKIIKKEGITTLWSGITASLVLVSNPVIQFVCYEQFTKSLLRQRSKRAGKSITALSSFEYFLLGALSKALATVMTYPYLTLKSRMQTGHGHQYAGFVDGIVTIYRHEGVAGFFKGLSAKFVQTVANAAFMFATYEYFLRITRKMVYRAAGLPVPKASVSQ